MPDSKLTDIPALAGPPADNDVLYSVDASDTTDGPSGSSKRILLSELMLFHSPACFLNTGSDNIVATADTTIGLNTELFDPADNYALSSSVVTVSSAGFYSISYSMPINDDGTAGATRCRVYAWLERDSGGGYSVIAQSRGQDYAREGGGGQGVSASFVCQLTAGDQIRLMIRSSLNTDLSTETGESQLSMHRIC